jgi:hypothetical protein
MRNTMANIIPVTLLFVFVILVDCCKKDEPCTNCPPPPPTNCEYPPGNRNFTWRLDTVAWWPSIVGGVWAFSDTDAWVMGYIGEGKSPWRIFTGKHWNGIQWDEPLDYYTTLHFANDVTGDDHYLVSVGFWAVGDSKAGLAEYDNLTKKWKGYQFQTQGELCSVWTDGNGYFIAVGYNGMVYTKDGYTSNWVYSKAPTEFNFTRVTGISKKEIYARGAKSLVSGVTYQQIWKKIDNAWIKLLDNEDTTGTPIKLYDTDNRIIDIAVSRCSITDSIKLYLIGSESYLLEGIGQTFDFRITNLSDLGLLLSALGLTGVKISLFSPNDYWVIGSRYNFYHWNGNDFEWIYIPGLPIDGTQYGIQERMIKTSSGRIFFPTEVSSQVYVVVQGVP